MARGMGGALAGVWGCRDCGGPATPGSMKRMSPRAVDCSGALTTPWRAG